MDEYDKNILFSCGLFRGISREECERLLSCINVRVKSFRKGETVWHTGDTVSSCAVVLSGRASAETVGFDGRRSVTASHGAGALIGDVIMSTSGSESPVDLVMTSSGALAFLDFGRIIGSCGQSCECHTQLRMNLLDEISLKFWSLKRKVAYLSVYSVRKRICMLLCDEYRRQASSELILNMNRDDMADLLGVNRSALSRELGRMRAEGLISYRKNRFSLLDLETLMSLSEE